MAGDHVAARVDQRLHRLGLAHRQRPIAGDDEMDLRRRIDLLHADGEGIDVAQHDADRLGGDVADLVGLGREAGGDAVHIVALVHIGIIAAGVHRVLVFVPQPGRVPELDLGIFLRRVQHERVEIAERGREHQRGAVEVDHQLHRLGDGVRLRHVLLFNDGDAGDGLQRRGGDRVRLVPTKVVLLADIDEADRLAGGAGALQTRQQRRAGDGAAQKSSTRGVQVMIIPCLQGVAAGGPVAPAI